MSKASFAKNLPGNLPTNDNNNNYNNRQLIIIWADFSIVLNENGAIKCDLKALLI